MKYSITIPAYKATFFEECLESILNQSYDDYEVIILNDCSPENIKEIVDKFLPRKNGEKIKYYENDKNVGAVEVVRNWNKLLELAKGEYIMCMGDDDKLASNCLEEYDKIIGKYPRLNVYHARTLLIDEQSKQIGIQEERPEWESVYSMIWHIVFKKRIQFIGDFLFRTSFLRENNGFFYTPLALGADWITSFQAAEKAGCANISTPVFFYRDNLQTISRHSNNIFKVEARSIAGKWFREFYRKEPVDVVDKKLWKDLTSIRQSKKQEYRLLSEGLDDDLYLGIKYLYKNRSKYNINIYGICIAVFISIARRAKHMVSKLSILTSCV